MPVAPVPALMSDGPRRRASPLGLLRRLHPPRNITFAVEYAPDVDMFLSLHVEDQVGGFGE